jgi:hypothetical protein
MGDGATPPATQPNLGRERLFKAAAILFGIVLAVMLVEISARIVSRRWFSSFLEREVDLMKRAYPVSYDPELGWVPRAGFSGNRNVGKTQVTINTNGLRANGGSGVPPSGSPVLAVGDSFTFGDGVSDRDTWPARLEKTLARPVLNAGVFGYGVDQMVLRAHKLSPQVQPGWVVVSFIPDDIERCELAMRGAHKPYFRITDGKLRLENQPVPPPEPVPLDAFRKICGYSWIVHSILKNVAKTYWYAGRKRSIRAHRDGATVAGRLLRELADELASQQSLLLVLAQYDLSLSPEHHQKSTEVLAHLKDSPAIVLDLYDDLEKVREQEPERFKRLFRGHMTGEGNQLVAERIAAVIRTVEGKLGLRSRSD